MCDRFFCNNKSTKEIKVFDMIHGICENCLKTVKLHVKNKTCKDWEEIKFIN